MSPEMNPKNRMRGIRGVTLTALAAISAAACAGSSNQPAIESQPPIIEADGSSEIVLTPEQRKAKEENLAEFEALIKEYIDTDVDNEYWEGVFNLRNASDKELSEQFIVEPHGHQDGVDYYVRFPDPDKLPSVFFSIVRNSQGKVFALIYNDKRNQLGRIDQVIPGGELGSSRVSSDRASDRMVNLGIIVDMPIKNMPPGLEFTDWEQNEISSNEKNKNILGYTGMERSFEEADGTQYSQHVYKNGERVYTFFNRNKADQEPQN